MSFLQTAHAASLPSITDELIAQKTQEVETILSRRVVVRAVVRTAMVAGACAAAYSYWFPKTTDIPVEAVVAIVSKQQTADSFLRWTGKKIGAAASGCMKFLSQHALSALLFTGAIKMNQYFFQEPNLAWYKSTYTSWKSIEGALEGLSDQGFQYLRELVYERLVDCVAAQIAFMKYTVSHLPPETRNRDVLCSTIDTYCEQLRQSVNELGTMVRGENIVLRFQVNQFVRLYAQINLVFGPVEEAAGITDGFGQGVMKLIDLLPAIFA